MYNITKSLVLFMFMLAIIPGCAHMNSNQPPPDLDGTWEGVYLSFAYLEIDKNKGYLLFLSENEEELYKLTNIEFGVSYPRLTFQNIKDQTEYLKTEISLINKNILIMTATEDDNVGLFFLLYR